MLPTEMQSMCQKKILNNNTALNIYFVHEEKFSRCAAGFFDAAGLGRWWFLQQKTPVPDDSGTGAPRREKARRYPQRRGGRGKPQPPALCSYSCMPTASCR
ncbi:hypothetical protein DWUX_374 [Desulfovibrio diazotrophicus]|nr:hypothetical protein DWUX_374 [Desulfovibrio diazotrophicus]